VRRQREQVAAVEDDAAARRREVAHQGPHQRRLAGAVPADEADHAAAADLEREAAQGDHRIDGDVQRSNLEHRRLLFREQLAGDVAAHVVGAERRLGRAVGDHAPA
jgi:hypothetical protein